MKRRRIPEAPAARSADAKAPAAEPAPGRTCGRTFTARALAFGLLGVFLVSAGAGYHNALFAFSGLSMISNHLPPVVFGYLMALALGWNGAMSIINRRWALAPSELMVVMVMTLMACFPASLGLMRYALRIIMNPWIFLAGQPEWAAHGLLDQQLSPRLFPVPVPHYDAAGVLMLDSHVYGGFFSGFARGNHWEGLDKIPWAAWMPALAVWGPLVVAMSLMVIAMTFLVHRQWSEHEQLSYPIAQVAACFWKREDNQRGVPDLFRRRLFWAGFAPLFALYLLEYANCWFPKFLPGLEVLLPNLKRWSLPILQQMPALRQAPGSEYLASQRISFAIVGLSYFVGTEISLTLGLSQFLLTAAGLVFFWSTGIPLATAEVDVARAGSYLGYSLVLLYAGRSYFAAVFRRAFLRRAEVGADDCAVLAARILALAFLAFVGILRIMGCDIPMAVFYGLVLMMLFLVFTRVICETGIPFLQAMWTPSALLVSLFGPAAVGPRALALMHLVNTVLAQDPRETLMPYVATSVRMASDTRISLKRILGLVAGSLAIALVIAFVSNLWVAYNVGSLQDSWAGNSVPKRIFAQTAGWYGDLKSSGEYELAESARGLSRLRLVRPDLGALRFFLVGAALVGGFSLLRFRFARFPIHPVLFIAWGSWPAGISWAAYMVGWFIKMLVTRLGGGRAYQRLKPVFVGLIAAELIIVCIAIATDLAYYWTTGKPSGIWTFLQAAH